MSETFLSGTKNSNKDTNGVHFVLNSIITKSKKIIKYTCKTNYLSVRRFATAREFKSLQLANQQNRLCHIFAERDLCINQEYHKLRGFFLHRNCCLICFSQVNILI